jgi:SulP family sulfate permease
MILAAVLFMKRMADVTAVRALKKTEAEGADEFKSMPEGCSVLEFNGPMFFASSDIFANIPIADGTKNVILRMRSVPSLDISALHSLEKVHAAVTEKGARLILSHVNEQPLQAMKKSGFYKSVGKENFCLHIDEALKKAEK